TGRLAALEHLLTADVIGHADGVRRTRPSPRPVTRRPRVAKVGRRIAGRSGPASKPQGSISGGRHRPTSVVVDASPVVMLSQPDAVADLSLTAARSRAAVATIGRRPRA